MSMGPVIVKVEEPGKINTRFDAIQDQPDVYGLVEKWDFLNAISPFCGNDSYITLSDVDSAYRPTDFAAARQVAEKFNPLWLEFLATLESDPKLYIWIW